MFSQFHFSLISFETIMAEYILRGPSQHLKEQSFGQLLLNELRNGGSRIAMVDAFTEEEITYNEILNKSISLALHLKKMNFKKGDIIAICSENSIYFTIPALASLYLGLIIAPLNFNYTDREILHSISISKPKLIFCSTSSLNAVKRVAKQTKFVERIIVTNTNAKVDKFVIKLQDLFDLKVPDRFTATPVDFEDVAAIMCSSGTTGLPKGVMLTHKNFTAVLQYLVHPDYGNYNPAKIAMCILPFYHAYGFVSHLCMLASNMKLIILNRFEETVMLSAIQKYKISYATFVPPLILFLSKSPLVDNYDISSLKDIICGAAPLGNDLLNSVVKRLNLNIRQGYGLTESTLATCLQPMNKQKSGSVGMLLPGIDCKVVNTETGRSLKPYEQGELCFRGSIVMKGYVGDSKATADTIKNGWLHTGDVGYYDNENYLFVVDRYKELIKYKGFQVPPAELEGILLTHPEILDCGVVGKPDDKAGELPVAFIVKKPNAKITKNDVINFVAENVSYQKRLHGGVIFVDSIPKNPTGKILRRILRDKLKILPIASKL